MVEDENRATVVRSGQMKTFSSLFADDDLLPYLVAVIYNVCVDYGM
jgi:hypothetical protein